jgi:hypothetical protein
VHSIEQEIADVIETPLPFRDPGESNGLAVYTPGELGERANDLCIIGDKAGRLNKNAKRLSQLRYVGGGDHAADGV